MWGLRQHYYAQARRRRSKSFPRALSSCHLWRDVNPTSEELPNWRALVAGAKRRDKAVPRVISKLTEVSHLGSRLTVPSAGSNDLPVDRGVGPRRNEHKGRRHLFGVG